jgi:hypothetical protein
MLSLPSKTHGINTGRRGNEAVAIMQRAGELKGFIQTWYQTRRERQGPSAAIKVSQFK